MHDYGYSESASRSKQFKTPSVMQFNLEDVGSYESETGTASANYRPRNSSSCLRRKVNPPKPVDDNARALRSSHKKVNDNVLAAVTEEEAVVVVEEKEADLPMK